MNDPYWPAERLLWLRHFQRTPPLGLLVHAYLSPSEDVPETPEELSAEAREEMSNAAVRDFVMRRAGRA